MRLLVILFCTASAIVGFNAASAKLYINLSSDKQIKAAGGDDRDLFEITPYGQNLLGVSAQAKGPTAVVITLRATDPQPITIIAYDVNLDEVGRASSVDGQVVLETDFRNRMGYLRVVPSGGSFDTPVGSKFRRSVERKPGDTAVLPPYVISMAGTGSSSQGISQMPPVTTTMESVGQSDATTPPNGPVGGVVARSTTGTLDAKTLAALTPFIGGRWATQFGYIAIDWDRPGETLKLQNKSIFIDEEQILVPLPAQKKWSGVLVNFDTGVRETIESPFKSGRIRSKFANQYFDCSLNSKTRHLDCRVTIGDQSGKVYSQIFPSITDEMAQARNAALAPARFPIRKPGEFHPKLGAFAEMAGYQWMPLFLVEGKFVEGRPSPIFELFGTDRNYTLIYQGAQLVAMTGTGPLTGRVATPTAANPGRQVTYTMPLTVGGGTMICFTSAYDDGQKCETWRVSADGAFAVKKSGTDLSFFKRIEPARPPENMGVFAKLHGRYFDRGDGQAVNFEVTSQYAVRHEYSSFGDYARSWSFDRVNGKVGDKSVADAGFSFDEDSYTIGRTRYRLVGNVIVVTNADGSTERWPETTWGISNLAWRDNRTAEDYENAVYDYNENQREEAESRARTAAMWGNVLGQLGNTLAGGTMSNTEVLRPTTPQEWAARLGVPMASSTGGVAGDMGGVRFTPAPRMTPEQQARADELERFKMREQIYRGERPTTIAEDAQARMAGPTSTAGQRRDQSGSGSASTVPENRITYVACVGSQRATVFRPGKDQSGNQEVLRFMFVHYTSRIGKISSKPGYGETLGRLSDQFRSQLPSIEAPDRYVSSRGGYCFEDPSYDQIVMDIEENKRVWERDLGGKSSRDLISYENVYWTPGD